MPTLDISTQAEPDREASSSAVDSGLVLYYPFSTNTGNWVVDASGNGNTGTVHNATWQDGGPCGGYLYLDGDNDYVDVGTGVNFPSWSAYSLSIWFLSDGNGDNSGYGQKLIDKSSIMHDAHLRMTQGVTGYVSYNMYESTAGVGVGSFPYETIRGDNRWHHIVIVRDGPYAACWYDGKQEGVATNAMSVFSSSPLYLGYSASTDALQRRFWSGYIDEVRIYNRALTASEANQLFLAGSRVWSLSVSNVKGDGYPQNGTHAITNGTTVSARVTSPVMSTNSATRYMCTGACVSGNAFAQLAATNVTMTITNHTTLTWIWQTQHLLETRRVGFGTVTPGGWYADGTNVVLWATAPSNSLFTGWSGDTNGCTMTGASLVVPMTQPRAITALFSSLPITDGGSLILWNRLGSVDDILNSAAGPGGLPGPASFVSAPFGNGLEMTNLNQFAASFPAAMMPRSAGCVEFWARVSEPSGALPWTPTVILLGFSDTNGNAYSMMQFNSNDGCANGGLCGGLWGIGATGTGVFGSWSYTSALRGSNAADWHHYALAWNVADAGIPAAPGRHLAVFVDGALNSGYWGVEDNPIQPAVFPENGRLGLLHMRNIASGRAAIDNIKIWDYAKSDFSDRFTEGPLETTRYLTVTNSLGAGTPRDGVHAVTNGEPFSASVVSPVSGADSRIRFVCTGAEVTGNAFELSSTTNVVMTVTNDVTLSWNWQTQYRLCVSTNGNGTATAHPEWCLQGSTSVITAVAGAGWHLRGWEGDTNNCMRDGLTLRVPMTEPRDIRAIFEETIIIPLGAYADWPENQALQFRQRAGAWQFSNEIGGLFCTDNVSSAAFQITVRGPGKVSFEWELPGADQGNVFACGAGRDVFGEKSLAAAETATMVVPNGSHRIFWELRQGASATGVSGIIRNIRWTPLIPAEAPVPLSGEAVARQTFTDLSWSGCGDVYEVYAGTRKTRLALVANDVSAGATVSSDVVAGLLNANANSTLYWRINTRMQDSFGHAISLLGSTWTTLVLAPPADGFVADQQLRADLLTGVPCSFGGFNPVPGIQGGALKAKIVSGSLPPGLSLRLEGESVFVTGVPSKEGTFHAAVQFSYLLNRELRMGSALFLDLTVCGLQKAVGTFNGWAITPSAGQGSVTLSVTQKGRITGSLSLSGNTYTFSAPNFESTGDGECSARVEAQNKYSDTPSIRLDVCVNTNGQATAVFGADAEGEIMLFRNAWKEPEAASQLTQLTGVCTFAMPKADGDEAGTERTGQLTILPNGNTRFTGKLSNGATAVASGTLLRYTSEEADETRYFALVYGYARSSDGKSHGIFEVLEVSPKEGNDDTIRFLEPIICMPEW